MERYELLLFLHVAAAAFWVGSDLLLQVLVLRARRRADAASLRKLFDDLNALDPIFFPATLLILGTGILMTIEGPWSFRTPWIVLGLGGFAFAHLYGFAFLGPPAKRLPGLIERDGVTAPSVQALIERFFVLFRVDTAVVLLIVFAMTVKPGWDDVVALALIGAFFVAVTAHSLLRARSIVVVPGAASPARGDSLPG